MLPTLSSTILATTLFLFFLLPGFTFLRCLWGSEKGNLQQIGIQNYLIWGTPASILFYFGLYYPYNKAFGVPISYTFSLLTKHRLPTLSTTCYLILFSLVVACIAGLIGYALKKGITKFWLDVRIEFLRFKNDWFYILTGRAFFYDYRNDNGDEIITADVLCSVDNIPVLYRGFVAGYNLKKDGALEYIRLTGVTRELLDIDFAPTPQSLPIPNNTLSISVKGDIDVQGSIETPGSIEVTGDLTADSIYSGGTISAGNIKAKTIKIGGISSKNYTTSINNGNQNGYFIPGNTLVIRNEEIKNINCSYLFIPKI